MTDPAINHTSGQAVPFQGSPAQGPSVTKSHLFSRIHVDANINASGTTKAGSMAFTELSTSHSPKALLKRAVINLGTLTGKLAKTKLEVSENGVKKSVAIAVSVKSLTKELGIEKNEARELARKENEFSQTLNSIHEITGSTDSKINEFFRGNSNTKISAREIGVVFVKATLGQTWKSDLVIRGELFTFDGKSVEQTVKMLGAGTYGTAYKIKSFSPETFQLNSFAKKVANADPESPFLYELAVRDLINEGKMLTTISELAKQQGADQRVLNGLQKPPHSVGAGFMTGDIYRHGDLSKVASGKTDMKPGDKLLGMDSLIRGLGFTQKNRIIHVDIKPANMFLDVTPEGKPTFRLADWGGAVLADQRKESLVATPYYLPTREAHLCHQANRIPENALQSISTFETGAALFEILAGTSKTFPYPRINHPDSPANYTLMTNHPFNRAPLAGYPKEVVDFVALMMHPNPAQRPIGDALVAQWDALTAKFGGLEQLKDVANGTIPATTATQPIFDPQAIRNLLFDQAAAIGARPNISSIPNSAAAEARLKEAGAPPFLVRFEPTQNTFVLSVLSQGNLVNVPINDVVSKGYTNIALAAHELSRYGGFPL